MSDLSEVRIKLDQMTERVLSRLKDRSRFPRNRPVYEPDGVPIEGRERISFLQFSLEGLEAYHGSLGRFAYPDQFPLVSHGAHATPVHRTVSQAQAQAVEIPIGDELVAFYIETLDELCPPGEDSSTYGETVYVDADLLNLLHERVNLGRQVAEAKASTDPKIEAVITHTAQLSEALRDRNREEALLDAVEQTAERYRLDPAVARKVFRWIIEETLALEVAYLQRTTSRS